jgi:hypothetical protein
MIERGVEIEIADQTNAAITIRPRSVSARVELRPFEKLAAERLTLAEDAALRCYLALMPPRPRACPLFDRKRSNRS